VLQKVQAAVCDNINLYITKYEEELSPFLSTFVGAVWSLLVKVGPQRKNDAVHSSPFHLVFQCAPTSFLFPKPDAQVVCSGIGFLTSVATSVYFELFNQEDAIKNIIEKIVIPNIKLREDDEEMFEINPQEYIRRDIEGSDSDTRRYTSLTSNTTHPDHLTFFFPIRRMASELIKGLRKEFELPVTNLVNSYVNALLAQYQQNRELHWQAKDAAFYLTTALTVTSKFSVQAV